MSTVPTVVIDLKRVPAFKKRLSVAVDRGVGRAAVVFEAGAKTAIRGGGAAGGVGTGKVWGNRSQPGGFPRSQSGQLRNSITSERAAWAEYLVGSNLRRGKYMEFGAKPRAKKGKYLAIPLNYEAARLQKLAGGLGLRAIEGLQIIAKTRRGWLMGFKKGSERVTRGKVSTRRQTKALFALVPSVTILPRTWLLPTMANTANQRAAARVLAETISKGIRGSLAPEGGAA